MEKLKLRHSFAYYLPQYHEVEENNRWWGKGFTEWVNLNSAQKTHDKHEIHYPSQLGYYDLSEVSNVEKQYSLAQKFGISSFCFWHYWFDNNEMLLESVAENILESNIDVEFCFAWANHSWYNKTKGILLKEQKYSFDKELYFNYLLRFFQDDRYSKINGKPVYFIYRAQDVPNFIDFKRSLEAFAIKNGFKGIFWVGDNLTESLADELELDYFIDSGDYLSYRNCLQDIRDKIKLKLQKINIFLIRKHKYEDVIKGVNSKINSNRQLPIVFPNWDSTIRHGKRGILVEGSTPELFSKHLDECKKILKARSIQDRIIVIKSWNEWAEGNFMEPSVKYEDKYLAAFGDRFEVVK